MEDNNYEGILEAHFNSHLLEKIITLKSLFSELMLAILKAASGQISI